MAHTEPQPPIRERIKDLNTKASYLLLAISFVYRTSPGSYLLKWALTLAAFVAVLPVQDYVESTFWLDFIRALKAICLIFALAFAICWIWMG